MPPARLIADLCVHRFDQDSAQLHSNGLYGDKAYQTARCRKGQTSSEPDRLNVSKKTKEAALFGTIGLMVVYSSCSRLATD